MNALDLIAAAQAAPKTHRVTTCYEGGNVEIHDTRSEATAENWAVGERRKIGRTLIDRASGLTVKVIAVTVDRI